METTDTGCAQTLILNMPTNLDWHEQDGVHTATGATGVIYTIEPVNPSGLGGGRLTATGPAGPLVGTRKRPYLTLACRHFATALIELKRNASRIEKREVRK